APAGEPRTRGSQLSPVQPLERRGLPGGRAAGEVLEHGAGLRIGDGGLGRDLRGGDQLLDRLGVPLAPRRGDEDAGAEPAARGDLEAHDRPGVGVEVLDADVPAVPVATDVEGLGSGPMATGQDADLEAGLYERPDEGFKFGVD